MVARMNTFPKRRLLQKWSAFRVNLQETRLAYLEKTQKAASGTVLPSPPQSLLTTETEACWNHSADLWGRFQPKLCWRTSPSLDITCVLGTCSKLDRIRICLAGQQRYKSQLRPRLDERVHLRRVHLGRDPSGKPCQHVWVGLSFPLPDSAYPLHNCLRF